MNYRTRIRWKLLLWAAVCGHAQQPVKSCAKLDVLSLEIKQKAEFEVENGAPQIRIGPRTVSNGVMVLAQGPILGSMDSEDITTELACTAKGVVLTATLTRSVEYRGAVRQNVLWSPRITLILAAHHPDAVIQTVWKMRLSNGRFLDRAGTPPFPKLRYPLTVTEILHSRRKVE